MIKPIIILFINALSLVSARGNAAANLWLAENAKKKGVTTLPSGLQYKVLTKGIGDSHPTFDSPCLCHYEGTLTDGTVFDSSYNRNKPSTFAPNRVIKGWAEAMQLMVVGEKWELYIPSDLAYGKSGSPPHIKSGDALIFKIEILEIKGDTAPASMCELSNIAHCSAEEKAYIKTAHKTYGGYSDMIEAQIRMIQNWDGTESEENIAWGIRRINILKQLLLVAEDNEDL